MPTLNSPVPPASGGLAGASGLSYDASGNLKTINGNTLTYDAWGRLASITGPNVSLAYTYDGAGRMLSRTSGGVTSYFLYEGDTLIAELDSQGYLIRGYVWGANGLVSQHTANLIILEGSGLEEGLEGGEEQSLGWPGLPMWDSLYYLFDGLGNTRGLTDAHGSVVGRSSFSGWGGNLQILGVATPFGRGGQSGGWTESVGSGGTGALVLSGHVAPRVYVPGTGQYGTPSGVGFGGGAHPYANPGADGVNEAPDASVDSVLAAERARWGGVNQLAGQMEGVLESAAGINPACSAAMAFSGYNAAGCRIGWGERLLNGLGAIPGVGALGAGDDVVRAAGSAVKTGNALARHADEARAAGNFLGSAGRKSWQSEYWPKTTTFRDLKVYQRDELIDPHRIDDTGRTNLQRMRGGSAPIGPDGNSLELHHAIQEPDGPIVEVTEEFHDRHRRTLHLDLESPSRIDRNAFRTWSKAYWRRRRKDFLP